MTTTVSLRRLVDVIDCAHVTAPFVEDDRRFPVASIRECQGAYVDLSDCRYTTKEFFDHLRASDRAPRTGDLLFIRNVSVGLVSAVAPGTPEFAVGQETVLLRRTSEVDPTFLRYALVGAEANYAIESAMIGSTFRRINVSAIRALPVALPPPEEQRLIANYLDRETARIDTLIEEQQRLIEILREQRAAVVDAALVPSKSWTRMALKHMLERVDQGVSPQAEAGLADEPGTWGVLKTGCVNRGVFRPEEHKRLPNGFPLDPAIAVRPGDVIVSRANGSPDLVGSAAIVDHLDYRLILSDKLFRLRPDRLTDARFLAWSLNSHRYRLQVRSAISGAEGLANNLPLSKLRAFEMHRPPLEEQRRIAAYLDARTKRIDTLIVETERFIELARERRAVMITAAVTGQVDVREVA